MPTDSTVIGKIHALRQMTVAELRCEWERLCGEPTRSRNKDYMYRRLAWRIQELHHGGLSDQARNRIDELAPESFVRARTPHASHNATDGAQTVVKRPRDSRLPSPGTVIVKAYKGRELRLVVHDDHFELDGHSFRLLLAPRASGAFVIGTDDRLHELSPRSPSFRLKSNKVSGRWDNSMPLAK